MMGEAKRRAENAPPPGPPGIPTVATVPLGPVPTGIAIQQLQAHDGNIIVVLVISTPTGVANYFVGGDDARKVGERLVAAGGAAVSNLLLPGGA